MKTSNVGIISAVTYTGLSLLISAIFFVVTLMGDYSWVARVGGSIWLFLLSMIILMPTVTALVKKARS
jgi:hypothetical protein